MKIIISPAKKMNENIDLIKYRQLPVFLEETKKILNVMKQMSYKELKDAWKCSDALAKLNYERIKNMNLNNNLIPAIFSYEGIQYQYMAPNVFLDKEFEYIEKHLRILSGFYGILKPFDGVLPYRLEMQAKLKQKDIDSIYDFWNNKIANEFLEENCIINLASKEYSKCIKKYIDKKVRIVDVVFGEIIDLKVKEKGTLAKMARGEMVRFMAENDIKEVEKIKEFNRLNFTYNDKLSTKNKYVFIKGGKDVKRKD